MKTFYPDPVWRKRKTTAALCLLVALVMASVLLGRPAEAAFPGATSARLAASEGSDPDRGPLASAPASTVTNTDDSGPGSLRQAVVEANVTPAADNITFDIPGAGAKTIAPASPLPRITSPLTVDGTTQPGYAGEPLIVLRGANAGGEAFGLDIEAGSSTVKGLVVNGFARGAIRLSGGPDNVVEGCYIGTDVSGARARGNGVGVLINGSGSNRIGGGELGQANVISSNGYGVNVEGALGQNAIAGNLIGTDLSGTAELGNTYSGVRLGLGVRGTSVAGNVISGNGTGIELFGYDTDPLRNNTVRANHIGTDRTGGKDLGNGGYGVRISGARFTDVIGNEVAFNGASGVAVLDGDGARISQNAIYANGPDDTSGGLGIDLGGDGVTSNDPDDADGGPNGLQNFPVLASAETAGDSTVIRGTLESTPSTAFGIEFFSSPKADPTGHGEGRDSLSASSMDVTTDGTGKAFFTYTTGKPVPTGHVVAATATPNDQASGTLSTSEFSEAITATDVAPPDTTVTSGPRSLVRSASATFSFASSEAGSRFECGLDGRAYTNCPSPTTLRDVADGEHTLRVRAVDASGNADPTPALRSWRVDTVGPSGRVKVNGGAATTGTRRVRLSLKAADPAPASGLTQVRLSNGGRSWTPWQRYATSRDWTLTPGAGTKTVFVQYRDRAGNPSAVAKDSIRHRP